ncbi:MAG: ribbon-helix-helix domain-containing protein [Bacteroidetes bacterium]|nr:ribbon-helix-helix domain-containing protein [Bacteroidota bacterium]
MPTFTSTLPELLWEELNQKSTELGVPKNKLLEKAIRLYLDHLKKAAYLRSYKKMASDTDLLSLAEEGMEDYLNQLRAEDEAR